MARRSSALRLAPPIYDPGGPILHLTDVRDPNKALTSAREEAARLGAAIIVVDQPATADPLSAVLSEAGYYRHCDCLSRPLPGRSRARARGARTAAWSRARAHGGRSGCLRVGLGAQ